MVPFVLAGFATLIVIGLTTYDSALEYLHDKFHSEWVRCGRPRGVLWSAPQGQPDEPYAHLWIGVKLVYRDPQWAFTDDSLRKRTRLARILIISGAVGLAVVASRHM